MVVTHVGSFGKWRLSLLLSKIYLRSMFLPTPWLEEAESHIFLPNVAMELDSSTAVFRKTSVLFKLASGRVNVGEGITIIGGFLAAGCVVDVSSKAIRMSWFPHLEPEQFGVEQLNRRISSSVVGLVYLDVQPRQASRVSLLLVKRGYNLLTKLGIQVGSSKLQSKDHSTWERRIVQPSNFHNPYWTPLMKRIWGCLFLGYPFLVGF